MIWDREIEDCGCLGLKFGSVRKIFSVLDSLQDASLDGEKLFTDPSFSRDVRAICGTFNYIGIRWLFTMYACTWEKWSVHGLDKW